MSSVKSWDMYQVQKGIVFLYSSKGPNGNQNLKYNSIYKTSQKMKIEHLGEYLT